MSPRKRTTGRSLPDNLTARHRNGRLYYSYRHPATGAEKGMGYDRAKAVQAAKLLNSRLQSGAETLVHRVLSQPADWRAHVERFANDTLPTRKSRRGKKLSPVTLAEYQRMLGHLKGAFSGPVGAVTRRQVAEFLSTLPGPASNRYRAVLSVLFKYAVAEGLAHENPVAGTLPQPEEVRRQRLTIEDYSAIREQAEPWFRNAMDLALRSLQRRRDLVRLKFAEHVEDGALLVTQSKTGVALRIHGLEQIIAACRDDIPSPYLIHRKPKRRRRTAWRDHWTQVSREDLSRAFQEARDAAGVGQDLPPEQRPSFHEIRSLGADLMRKAGRNPQPLLGHSEWDTTKGYLDGHQHVQDVDALAVVWD